MIIDAHAHFVPQALIDDLVGRSHPAKSVKVTVENGGVRLAFGSDDAKRPIPRGMETADARQKWLAAHGIDRQVVGGWLDMFGYDLPVDEAADWSRFLNAHMLAATKSCRSAFRSPPCRCNQVGSPPRSSRRRSMPASTAP
jgi:aminocarboxymuconate-semialdehyde decarboxylase